MAAWSVFLGFAAILLVFRTTDWRGLMRQAQEDQDGENGGGEGTAATARARRRRAPRRLREGAATPSSA